MEDKNIKNFGQAVSENSDLDALIKILRQDADVWRYINRNCRLNPQRITLLNEIILLINIEKTEKLKEMIYLYGSMVRGKDLIARQMFLWMLAMLDENIGSVH